MSSHSQATFFLDHYLLHFVFPYQTYDVKNNITRRSPLNVRMDVKCMDVSVDLL